MSWKRLSALLTVAAGLAYAQDGSAPQAAFEVASVKVSGTQSKRDSGGGPGTSDPGQCHFNSATMQDLIAVAFHARYFQIVSKMALDRDRYDVVAKVPAGSTRDQFRAMMQNLLAERFHLKLHQESRELLAWDDHRKVRVEAERLDGYRYGLTRAARMATSSASIRCSGQAVPTVFPEDPYR
jgi:hypothetical protein